MDQRAVVAFREKSGLFTCLGSQTCLLTSDYLFCRFVRSLALVGHLGLGHIGVSKWTEELKEIMVKFYFTPHKH